MNINLPYNVTVFNPLSLSLLISVQILLTLSTQNMLFGYENTVNDHTQQFI